MKKLLVTATVLGALASGSALAADLPAVQPYAAAAPIAYDWTGFYLGANVGYGFGDGELSSAAGEASDDYDGFLGGIQAGYNHQFGQVVVGVEADLQLSGVDFSATIPGIATASADLDYLATVRARVGYAFDRFLPYVTGGFAFGQNELSYSFLGFGESDEQTHFGWTVGAGVEVAMTQNLSVKAEYLYVDLGEETYFNNSAVFFPFQADAELHIARVGLNYKF